jgi:hypothetical protein
MADKKDTKKPLPTINDARIAGRATGKVVIPMSKVAKIKVKMK